MLRSSNYWLHSGYDAIKYLTYFGVHVTPNIFLFSFQTYSYIYITQSSYRLGFLMTFALVRDLPLSFLMGPSLSLVLSFGTSEFAFMGGLLPSICCFLYQLLPAPAVHLLLMSEPHWMVIGWLLCFLCHVSLFLLFLLLYFQKQYFVVLM